MSDWAADERPVHPGAGIYRARRLCRRALEALYRPYVLRRIAAPSSVRVCGYRLQTHPDVFHPVYFFSSRLLASYLQALPLRGKRLLDMGTGSGLLGIAAADRGAVVTACDINPRAVALARENAARNGVAVEVYESDLFAALPPARFDVICFNIPFYPKRPGTLLEAAFFAGEDFETVRTFAAGCRDALAPEGQVIIAFSEDSGREHVLALFAAAGLHPTDERTVHKLCERLHLVCLRPPPPGIS